jgi:hypothetical protein
MPTRELYLDLLKRCLVNWIYMDDETKPFLPRKFSYILAVVTGGLRITIPRKADPSKRSRGEDWPAFGHSMIGFKRLDNIQFCAEEVLRSGVPGDFIETGVWRGGACIFMRGILKAHGVTDRKVWAADSFRGLPAPNMKKYPADKDSMFFLARSLAVSLETVKSNFEKYGLLDDQVVFLKGWFRDTLPNAPIKSLAVLRLDGDMYESTMDALTNLYPKVSPGGYVIVDDYDIPACRQAVSDYRDRHSIKDEILSVDNNGAFWKKSR